MISFIITIDRLNISELFYFNSGGSINESGSNVSLWTGSN